MSYRSDTAFPWLYQGIWGALVEWFRIPDTPPTMPAAEGEEILVFRAAPGYLKYKLIGYWIFFWIMLAAWVIGLGVLFVVEPVIGAIALIPAVALFLYLTLTSYVALYLDYDTTWYAVGPNSIRTREGVWLNREITVNYDNVQNVATSQGPLQRSFGISDLRVDTAGLASAGGNNQAPRAAGVTLRGLDNAEHIKQLIQAKCDASTSTGLGDEDTSAVLAPSGGWSPAHIAILREIRDAAAALKA